MPVLPAPYDVVNVAPTHVVTYSYAFTVLTDDATAAVGADVPERLRSTGRTYAVTLGEVTRVD